ncbi:MAG: efflux RND transporter permease subunit [bacterium]|nr:efflux RND transporter permease subunit [bacterium]
MTEPKIVERMLPRFSLRRPVTVTMILVALLVIGFIAYKRIKTDLLPAGLNSPQLWVWIPYRDANPREIEEQIVKPIEGQLKTVKNIKNIISYSRTTNCSFRLEFAQGTNMDLAYSQVGDRLERSRPLIPDEIDRIFIWRQRETAIPTMFMGISFGPEVEDPHYVTDTYIKKAVEGINGVANVELHGIKERFIQIVLDNDKLKTFRINLYQLMNRLMTDNFAMSNGYVFMGKSKYMLRCQSRFKTLEDVSNIEIGKGLRLSDIANVKYDFEEETRGIMRVDGKLAAGMAVFKESRANTVEVSRKITAKLEEQFKNHPGLKGVDYFIFWNQGRAISESIDNINATAFWGGIFAFLVLLYFLRKIRVTILLTLAIPLSLLVTVLVLYFMGWTLNTITMMGIMLSIGLVVDNSIVITENIYRFFGMGYNLERSSILGASEVGMAITMATLTTIVVFLPMMIMGGDSNMSFFMVRIGTPVIIAILASLFIALVFIPLASVKFLKKEQISVSQPSHSLITQQYQNVMVKILKHRKDAVIIIIGLIISQFVAFGLMKKGLTGGGLQDAFVMVEFPNNYSIEKRDQTLLDISERIMERDDVYHIDHISTRARMYRGWIEIYLEPQRDKQWYQVIYRKFANLVGLSDYRRLGKEQLAEDIKEHLPVIPGVKMSTSFREEEGKESSTLSFTLSGYDTGILSNIAADLEKQIRRVDGVLSIENDKELGNDEIHVAVDRNRAFRMGTNSQYISQYLAFNLRRRKISNYQTPEKEIPVYVLSSPDLRRSVAQLQNTFIKADNGKETTLSSISDITFHKSMGTIRRENGRASMQIKISISKDGADEGTKKMGARVEKVFRRYNYPTGYAYGRGRQLTRFREQDNDMIMAVGFSIVFVMIIMGILFESIVLPFSVLVAIPAAFVGSFWLLYITGTTFEIMAGIGLVILVGVVVNNAIVLIDLINQYRKTGMNREQAILVAGVYRFRPILMTALTTIFGLIPMAIGNATLIGTPYSPMGVTMIGGLISSTFLTLFAVPVFYTYFDDLQKFLPRFMKRF